MTQEQQQRYRSLRDLRGPLLAWILMIMFISLYGSSIATDIVQKQTDKVREVIEVSQSVAPLLMLLASCLLIIRSKARFHLATSALTFYF